MKSSARQYILLLAVFLLFIGSGFTVRKQNPTIRKSEILSDISDISFNSAQYFFNPLTIPEIKPPPPRPSVIKGLPAGREAIPGQLDDNYQLEAQVVTTASDPRFGIIEDAHRELFIPASEVRPPEVVMSIPIKDNRQLGYYDLNEWEEKRIFSSNFYTDSSLYVTGVEGDKYLSPNSDGTFYETNLRYELFSTHTNGDSLSLTLDTTYSNDEKAYDDNFTLNQATIESRTRRSRLVFGHAFPEMSEYSMTQNVLGIYGIQNFEYANISGFAGYYANERDDLDNPRYIKGIRLEHQRDQSFKFGFNFVGTEDDFSNSASNDELPEMSNRIISADISMKPTENLNFEAEIAQSDTDFDKRAGAGEEKGEAYRFRTIYETDRYHVEAGIEQADTSFLSVMGNSPRDERAYFARFYYELNQYISTRFSHRISRDNLANYQRSIIKREQPEIQLTFTPSEYYKDLRIDFFYQPMREYSDTAGFMDRYRDLVWMEVNQHAGQMNYYLGLSKTIDRDDINMLNDHDVNRCDFTLTWEYNKLNSVYTSYSLEKTEYKRAEATDETSWIGFGGSSRFGKNVLLNLDYMREVVDPSSVTSEHDRINMSLTREFSPSARIILNFEGNISTYMGRNAEFEDYTARLRYLRAF